jgi:hypothetical protein
VTTPDDDNFGEPEEYTTEEVLARPIPAKCPRCKRSFLGRDAIRAPTLDHVCCFYCGSNRSVHLVIHPAHKGFVTAKMARHAKATTDFPASLFAETPPLYPANRGRALPGVGDSGGGGTARRE